MHVGQPDIPRMTILISQTTGSPAPPAPATNSPHIQSTAVKTQNRFIVMFWMKAGFEIYMQRLAKESV
jgi:hypothetical protein